jgi:hypothetical protein
MTGTGINNSNSSGIPIERDFPLGWVAEAFTLSALSFAALGAIWVLLKPLTMAFGWSRGDTSLGYTAIAFSSVLFALLWWRRSDDL